MKKFLVISFIFIFSACTNATVITGGVKYDINRAKNEILSTQPPSTPSQLLRNNIIDTNNSSNKNALLNGITELKDRKLAKFSDGSYAVLYYDNPFYSFYYSESGKLISYTYKTSQNYPCKFKKFKPDGSLINTGYRVSEQESFIYSPEGKLLAHWLGNKCFDGNNNLIMTRQIME